MKQITQKLISSDMKINDLPRPQISPGMIIVKNHYSIISSGTEMSTIRTAQKGLVGKAKEKPDQLKIALETLKNQGPIQTYRAIMKRLDSYSPLGYSSSGEVIEIGSGVENFKVGDKVACAGAGYANHSEIVKVPVNLCVKLAETANLRDAAYNTLGAIAMQSVRQANMQIGETCVVIGLGLIGHLVALILKASGVKVIGIDISENAVKVSNDNSVCNIAFSRSMPNIEENIMNFTKGIGSDAVIIAAQTSSLDPINFSGKVVREKGKVVILGDVPTGFDRDPYWYRKELELRMVCSYGPGRYDRNYEEKGIDYPISYVRWTENRNMQAFQELLESSAIDITYLTTHEFDFIDAIRAYEILSDNSKNCIGIALKYDISSPHLDSKIIVNKNNNLNNSTIKISFIGAGSYAQGFLLPNLPKSDKISRVGVLTERGNSSRRVSEKFNFEFCTSSDKDIFNKKTNTVFITTRHDSHFEYVIKAIKSNNYVYVEKPLCIYEKDIDQLIDIQNNNDKFIMVGYNRRFSPLSKEIKNIMGSGKMSMIYRISAGSIPKESWIQDRDIGGGRIIGEVCHFIDYLIYINGSIPINVSANIIETGNSLDDSVNILLKFKNGSSGIISYNSNGSNSLPKEYFEVSSKGISIILDDFKKIEIYTKGKPNKKRLFTQNKGQKKMINSFFDGIESNTAPIKFKEIIAVSRTCFKILESIEKRGEQVKVIL